jgi:hypothetical protein
MTVRPVLVTVLLATTANVVRLPSGGAADGTTPIVFTRTITNASHKARKNRGGPRRTPHV